MTYHRRINKEKQVEILVFYINFSNEQGGGAKRSSGESTITLHPLRPPQKERNPSICTARKLLEHPASDVLHREKNVYSMSLNLTVSAIFEKNVLNGI